MPSCVYREYPPTPAVECSLVCAWTLEISSGDRQHRQRVLPDGCADIVWIGDAAPVVVGPMTRPTLAKCEPGTILVGLRFRPAAASRVFGIDAQALVDRHVPLRELWDRDDVKDVSERLIERRTAAERATVAQAFLGSRHHAIPSPDPLMQHAMSVLSAARPDRIDGLADTVGVSERHLRRRFLASVGYSPKLFQRVLRFQRLLTLARAHPSARLGHLALLAGYADQAHMTREVGALAGVTPSALLGHVTSALTLSDLVAGAS